MDVIRCCLWGGGLGTANAFNAFHAGFWLPFRDLLSVGLTLLHIRLWNFLKRRRGAIPAVGRPGNDQPGDGLHRNQVTSRIVVTYATTIK